jgi:hypothetical protein
LDLYLEDKETKAGLKEVMEWWIEHYEGMEHLTLDGKTNPETWYAVNTILKRCLDKINKTL